MVAVYVAVTVLIINAVALAATVLQALAALGAPLVASGSPRRTPKPRTRPDGRADLRPVPAEVSTEGAGQTAHRRW